MNTKASSSNWQSDPEGRINNISLAPNPKNTLFPLLESIMNSIQAIEERFGSGRITEGVIEVTFIRSQNGDCVGFRIRDNGVGFNEDNLNSFKKMDSQKKVKIGGKGVGRLLWLKVTDHVHIRSTFLNESCIQTVTFDFSLHDPIQNLSFENAANGAEIETTVELHPYHAVYSKEIPKKATTIANRILAHFIRV